MLLLQEIYVQNCLLIFSVQFLLSMVGKTFLCLLHMLNSLSVILDMQSKYSFWNYDDSSFWFMNKHFSNDACRTKLILLQLNKLMNWQWRFHDPFINSWCNISTIFRKYIFPEGKHPMHVKYAEEIGCLAKEFLLNTNLN